MTPMGFFISSSATGTVLKFAAMGVHRVPQKPQVKASMPMTTGFAPWASTNG